MARTSFIPRAGLAAGLCALPLLVAAAAATRKTATAARTPRPRPPRPAPAAADGGAKECSVEGKKIQYVGPLKSNPVLQVMAAGFTEKADELGFDGEVMLTEDADPQRVLALGQQALAQGSDGMVLQAFDPSLYPLIKQATDQGVPVVVDAQPGAGRRQARAQTDRPPRPGEIRRRGRESDRRRDRRQRRRRRSRRAASTRPRTSPPRASRERWQEQFPDVKVLKSQVEGFEPAAAIARASSILQGDKEIVAAFSTTGGGVKTWSSAADESGRRVVVVGMDYTRPNLDLVRSGRAFAVVAQPIFEEHALAVEALRDVICGEQVEAEVLPESPIVTRANADDYYAILDKAGT